MRIVPVSEVCRVSAIGWIAVLYCLNVGFSNVALAQANLPRNLPASSIPGYETHVLKYKTPREVEQLLAPLLKDFGDQVHWLADTSRGQILVRGSSEVQSLVRQLLHELDQPNRKTEADNRVLRVYTCPASRFSTLLSQLKASYGSRSGIRIIGDQTTGQIVIVAPTNVQESIARQYPDLTGTAKENQSTLSPTNQPGSSTARVLPVRRFVRAEHSNILDIVSQLQRTFAQRMRPTNSNTPSEKTFVLSNNHRRLASLRVIPSRNAISMEAEPAVADQLARLISAYDQKLSEPNIPTRIIPLRNADVKKVREAVRAFRQRAAPARNTESRLSPRSNTGRQAYSFSPRSKGARLVNYLFQTDGERGPTEIFIPLPSNIRPNDPRLSEELDHLSPNERRRRLLELGIDVEMETLPDLDVIILRGNQKDLDEIQRIIDEIERLSEENEPRIEVIALLHIGSAAAGTLLTPVLEELNSGRQGRVSVTPLVKPNSLLLIGWGESLEATKELISKLDQPVAAASQLRVFRLHHAPATATATTVQSFFSNRSPLGVAVQIVPDRRTNSLIVQAAPRDLQEVELLLQRLDTPRGEAVNQVRIFHLQHSLAAELSQTLQNAITASQSGDGGSVALELLDVNSLDRSSVSSGLLANISIVPDAPTNTLIITAPAESMDLIAALIKRLDDRSQSVSQIKVFRIFNGDASGLVVTLRSLLPTRNATNTVQLGSGEEDGSLVPLQFAVDSRTNSIIATGSAGDLNIIEALLVRLDEKDLQQRINTVFELKNSPALDVATAINEFLRSERQLVQATPGPVNPFSQIEREVIVVPEPVSNSLILSATPRFFDDIKKLIEDLDAQPPQVIIQVLIAEVQLSNANEFGVELGLQDSILFDRSLLGDLVTLTQTITPQNLSQVTSQTIVGASNSPGFNFNNEALGNSGSTAALSRSNVTGSQGLSTFNLGRVSSDLGFGGLVFSASSESVSVLIRALEESRYSEVLARPQITTLDNQSAFIQVGQRVPRIIASTISQTGQVNSVDLENVGLILGVTPRISPDGMVVMEIDAERSQIDRIGPGIPVAISATGVAVESPAIDVQTAQTTVSAADGETIVLGGLITKNTRTIDRRVPYLADIPVLGSLFRFKSKQEQRNELLIILTPHVIRSAEDAERVKLLETSRMNWTSSDVHELYGDAGLCTRADCPLCEAKTEVIYPDFNPRAELPELLEKTEELPEPNEEAPNSPGYFPNHESPEMFPPVSQSRTQRPNFPLTRNNRSTNESTRAANRPYLTNSAPPLPLSDRNRISNQNLQQHNPPSKSAMQRLANQPRGEVPGRPNRGPPNYSSTRYGAGVSSANYNRGKVIR